MADTAPVYASAFFSNPGAVYGLATVGQIPVGITGGGMGTIAPLERTLVGYDADGAVGRFTSPIVSGTMSAAGFSAGSGGIGSTGNLTVTGGATALCTLTVSSTATLSGGLSLAAGSLTVVEGNLDLTKGNLTLTDGYLRLTKGDLSLTDGNLTLADGDLTLTAGGVSLTNGGLRLTKGNLTLADGDLDLTGNLTVTGVTTLSATLPVEPQHAATKAYVDSVASGLHVKAAVRARTTGALPAYSVTDSYTTLTANNIGTLSNSIFDGVTIVGTTVVEGEAVEGTRVLVANEPAGSPDLRPNNGIYVVTSVGGVSSPWVLTRAEDADESAELRPGSFVFVTGGEDYQGDGFVLTTSDGADPTVGTTPLVFTQFSEAGTITPGGSNGQFQVKNGADFDGTELLTLTGGVVTATGPIAVGTPTENGHAATKLYVDSEIADAVAATAPAGSTGQVQYRTAEGDFGASAALTYDDTTGVAVTGVPFTVTFEPGGGVGATGRFSVGATGLAISGIATTICASGEITAAPGISVSADQTGVYGPGGSGGVVSLIAGSTGVSITGAYEIISGSGKPIRLKGDPTTSGDLPGATGYVAVGAISDQADGQEGAAVAFGAGAGVTAPRGIALGMGAVARVADAAVIPALSLSQNVAGAAAAVGRSGLAAYAAGMTFLPSAPLDLKTAGDSSSFEVPAGAMFIPLGAVVWLHAIATTADFSASPTLEVWRTSASGAVILPATALAITEDSPVGLAVGATPSDFSAVSGGDVIFYRVATAVSAGGLSSASARVALYGLCVEL